jgi:hypothetical protein
VLEVFHEIVNRDGEQGKTERYVDIEVHVSDERTQVDWDLLDTKAMDTFRKCVGEREHEAVSGIAMIAWKSDEDRTKCIEGHVFDRRRQKRWKGMQKHLERMKQGEFPQFAHAYLHPSLTGTRGLTVIDGTRRMLAYLELGRNQMPIVVFRRKNEDIQRQAVGGSEE